MKGKLSSPATAIVINLINGCCCGLVWNARSIHLQLLLLFFIINHHALVIWFLYSGVFCSLCQSVVVYWIPSRSLPPSIRASSCHYSACAVHEVCKWHPTLKFSVDWWKFRIIECFLSSSSSATPAPPPTIQSKSNAKTDPPTTLARGLRMDGGNGWWRLVDSNTRHSHASEEERAAEGARIATGWRGAVEDVWKYIEMGNVCCMLVLRTCSHTLFQRTMREH